MIGKNISHYRIIDKIGEGGMGEVYLAEDTELNRKVALKFLPPGYGSDPDVLTRFKREAQAAAALNHPNIITIHEVSSHEERPFIVMAYVDGKPLRELIREGGLSRDRVLDIVIEILDGLNKAHTAEVVHRDIKPENVLIDSDGRVKILDFGLAKLRGATQLTDEKSTLGTVYYMSPEQTRSAEVDHRSDIFSVGAVLYEMIAGQVPFSGDHAAAIMYAISSEEPQPLSRYSKDATPELERIVSKALAKDPSERYQSAADMLADVRRERRVSDTQSAVNPVERKPKSNALKFAIPAVIVAIAAVALFFLLPRNQAPVVSAENLLAVMYFENIADPDDAKRHGEIITNLLITDLSEATSLKVLSSQRLYDILKLQGKEGLRQLDKDTASDIATHAGAKWMLTGSILQSEPQFIVTAQLVNVGSGEVASSQRVTGEEDQAVFAVVELLTREVIDDLSLPSEQVETAAPPQATESEEAYRLYLSGIEARNRYDMRTATDHWRAALDIDPEFPLAHFEMAIPSFQTSRAEKRRHIGLAYKYRDRAPDMMRRMIESSYVYYQQKPEEAAAIMKEATERYPDEKRPHYALAMMAWTDLKDLDISVHHLNEVLRIDPLDKLAYNQLAYRYLDDNNKERALWAINKYIELAPDEPNPYDTRGEIHCAFGELDEALASFELAVEKHPTYFYSMGNLGQVKIYQERYDEALEHFEAAEAVSPPYFSALLRTGETWALGYPGRFEAQIEALYEELEVDAAAGFGEFDEPVLGKYYHIANAHRARREFDQALEVIETHLPMLMFGASLDETNGNFYDDYYVHVLIERGDMQEAVDAVTQFRRAAETTYLGHTEVQQYLGLAEGLLERAQGSPDCLPKIKRVADAELDNFVASFELARAYQQLGQHDDAIATFEMLLTACTRQRLTEAGDAVKAYYFLAMCFEDTGAIDKAIANYERFLEIWKDADAVIPELEDARERLQRLRAGS